MKTKLLGLLFELKFGSLLSHSFPLIKPQILKYVYVGYLIRIDQATNIQGISVDLGIC